MKHMQALDQMGLNLEQGKNAILASDTTLEEEFEQYEPLAGFVGYEDTKIRALGFYKYKCATRPDDVTGQPGTGEGEGEGGEGQGEGDGTGEPTDPNEKPLDPDCLTKECQNKNSNVNDPNQPIGDVEEDEDSALSTILIILVCVLIPLVLVLATIVYLFRKNKQNAIAAAAARRNSSIKKQQELDEKMEAKGAVDIFADDKKQG